MPGPRVPLLKPGERRTVTVTSSGAIVADDRHVLARGLGDQLRLAVGDGLGIDQVAAHAEGKGSGETLDGAEIGTLKYTPESRT